LLSLPLVLAVLPARAASEAAAQQRRSARTPNPAQGCSMHSWSSRAPYWGQAAPGSGSPGANCSRCVFALPGARRAPTPRGAHCGRTLGHPQHARHLYFALQLQALRCATCAPSLGCWRARCPIAREHRRGHTTAGPSRARREPGTPQPCTRACDGTLNRETCLLAGGAPPAPRDGRPQAALTPRIALDLGPTAGNPIFGFAYPY
jgi:hypothetical protein